MAFRIDEFAATPDGTLSRTDMARFLNVGFDIALLLVAAPDSRIYTPTSETRTHTPASETRSYTPTSETRTYTPEDS